MEIDLDLLFYAGHHTGNQEIIDIATMHAKTVLKHVVRDDGSTCHLVVFDTQTGDVKKKLTCQGYSDESTWSRYVPPFCAPAWVSISSFVSLRSKD